jgi:hypothetical protein
MTMASHGYATSERIGRVQPRLAAGRRSVTAVDAAPAAAVHDEPETLPRPDEAEPFDDWIGERLASFREALSQTTFFLTDPNSWR